MNNPIQEIKLKVHTVDYINKFYPDIELVKAGKVYQGYCPFPNHKDGNKSFSVFQDGGYKCFGCHAHGDIIELVQTLEGLDKKEACHKIASNMGFSVQFKPPNPHHETHKELMNSHNRRYWNELHKNNDAMFYLKNTRALTQETINKFRIGLVPRNEYQNRQDITGINGRIAFPILEQIAREDPSTVKCIGMGYRVLDDNIEPKYKNDQNHSNQQMPTYGVFEKSKCLYGYNFAANSIRSKGYSYVVEGYMDVISMHQAGMTNTVGTMGTSLSEQQVDMLASLASTVILFYDSDKAGLESIQRNLPILLEKKLRVLVCLIEENLDPADLCVEYSFDTYQLASFIKSKTVPALKYIIDTNTKHYEEVVLSLRLNAYNNVDKFLSKIKDTSDYEVYKDLLNKKLDMF